MTDTGEQSFDLETTVPTDLTVTSSSDHLPGRKYSRLGRIHQDNNFEVEHLELELRRKNALITNLRSQMDTKARSLNERLKEAEHQTKLTQAKTKMQVKLLEDNANRKVEMLEKELDICLTKIEDMQKSSDRTRRALDEWVYSDREYHKLKDKPLSSLNLVDYVLLKIYDHNFKLKKENDELKNKLYPLQEYLIGLESQAVFLKEDQLKLLEESSKLKERVKEVESELQLVRSCVEHGNFASENFLRVKSERDILVKDVIEMKKNVEDLKIEILQRLQEKEEYQIDNENLKLKYENLSKECVSLGKQLNEVTEKWGEAQDESIRVKAQLDKEQISKEELLQRMVNIRDKTKSDNEERMFNEIERVKICTAQSYENEIRSLKEAKSSLQRERDTLYTSSLDLRKKYEDVYSKYLQNSSEETKKVSHLEKLYQELKLDHQKVLNSLKMTEISHKEKVLECNKVATKLQLTEQELDFLRNTTNERIRKLETELGTSQARFQVFDKIEKEMSETIHEAASGDHLSDEMLGAIADQIDMPAKARHNFVKSVHLTRQVLHLERLLHANNNKLAEEESKSKKLQTEVAHLTSLLDQVGQPYSYLIVTIREHESTIATLNFKIESLTKQLEASERQNKLFNQEQESLNKDLEKLYRNREETKAVKEQLAKVLKELKRAPPISVTEQLIKEKKHLKPKWK